MVFVCARCGKDDTNFTVKMLHSLKCKHCFCEHCFQDTFIKRSGHTCIRCPSRGCGETLTKTDLSHESTEDSEFKRECLIRVRLQKMYVVSWFMCQVAKEAELRTPYVDLTDARKTLLETRQDITRSSKPKKFWVSGIYRWIVDLCHSQTSVSSYTLLFSS